MTGPDRALLAERAASVERHLARDATHLPADATAGPPDLRAFLAALRNRTAG